MTSLNVYYLEIYKIINYNLHYIYIDVKLLHVYIFCYSV